MLRILLREFRTAKLHIPRCGGLAGYYRVADMQPAGGRVCQSPLSEMKRQSEETTCGYAARRAWLNASVELTEFAQAQTPCLCRGWRALSTFIHELYSFYNEFDIPGNFNGHILLS
jgi:hypothetical protein